MKAIKIREILRPDPKSLIMRPVRPEPIMTRPLPSALASSTPRPFPVRRPDPTTILARPVRPESIMTRPLPDPQTVLSSPLPRPLPSALASSTPRPFPVRRPDPTTIIARPFPVRRPDPTTIIARPFPIDPSSPRPFLFHIPKHSLV